MSGGVTQGAAHAAGANTQPGLITANDGPVVTGAAQPPAPPSTPAAEEWQVAWRQTLPQLTQIGRAMRPPPNVTIMRSSQLDAARLDEELTAMLREQFVRCFALFRPGAVARLQPELTLLLDLLIFRFSVWEGRPLPGMALMNLRFRNEAAAGRPAQQPTSSSSGSGDGGGSGGGSSGSSSGSSNGSGQGTQAACPAGGHSGVEGPGLSLRQRGLYCLGAVVLRYAWARLGHHAAARHWADASAPGGGGWRRRAWEGLRQAESAYRLAALANFLVFLRTGRYRSLLERLLRARLVYQQPSAARAISFEYLNRQLVWSELSELLLFLLPLLNVRAIKHTLRAYLPRLPMLGGAAGGSGAHAAAAASTAAGGGGAGLCGICGAGDVLTPYAAVPCSHAFCYYCLRSHCLADPQYSCPLCLKRVDALQPLLPKRGSSSSSADGAG